MHCQFCKKNIENPVFDLGNTAVSNDLIIKKNLHSIENTYPLIFHVCPSCLLAQTEQYRDGYEIFSDDYVYFSSCSNYWLEHAKQYVELIIKKLNLTKGSFVLEIASNDGYLLTNFVEKNIECLGVEPTKSTAIEAVKKGVKTLVEFFNVKTSKNIVADFGKADLIIANNVLAHVPDINDFVSALKGVLKDDGVVTIEVPHVLKLIEKSEFDTIYHEHFFYFSVLSLTNILDAHDLSIYDIDELDTHGGSIRVYVTHVGNDIDKNNSKESLNRVLNKELKYGLDSLEYYEQLKDNSFEIKLNSLKYLINKKISNKKIAAFGAAAKGNTFLNYCGIKNNIIDFVVDETPFKIGKFLPQSRIPIVNFDVISKEKPDVIVILPWNHKKEILKKLEFTKEWGCEIVTFIPNFEKLQ